MNPSGYIVLLGRNAEAESDDHGAPLTERGVKQAQSLAQQFVKQRVGPPGCAISGFTKRGQETLHHLLGPFNSRAPHPEKKPWLSPGQNPPQVEAYLRTLPESMRRVLIVMPGAFVFGTVYDLQGPEAYARLERESADGLVETGWFRMLESPRAESWGEFLADTNKHVTDFRPGVPRPAR